MIHNSKKILYIHEGASCKHPVGPPAAAVIIVEKLAREISVSNSCQARCMKSNHCRSTPEEDAGGESIYYVFQSIVKKPAAYTESIV